MFVRWAAMDCHYMFFFFSNTTAKAFTKKKKKSLSSAYGLFNLMKVSKQLSLINSKAGC